MTAAQKLHAIRLQAPFYLNAHAGQRSGLHRYLDPDFINRYRQDIQRGQFTLPQFHHWLEEERHSRHGKEPVLRLPSHRAFHIFSTEAVCERLGYPALDPQKITSAGFVIRKISGGREYAWMMEDGEAIGWQLAPTELRDPDIHRRLCANGVLHKRNDEPSYSGEQTHPLHPFKTQDAQKKIHTLLFGYLPLGGFYYHRDTSTAFDPASQHAVQEAAKKSLPWPFGYRTPLDQSWTTDCTTPLNQGRPSKALFELLKQLVNRYHLGQRDVADNAALERLFDQIWLYEESQLPNALRHQEYTASNQELFKPYRKQSLLSYLRACFDRQERNPLVAWIARFENAISKAGGIDLWNPTAFERLPDHHSTGLIGGSILTQTLYLLPSDAQDIRSLLDQRLRNQALTQVKEIPLPKFSQNRDDLYQIVPFVRSLNDCGKEQIQWADASARSILFRVAAPFDPEASRPAMIQMPSLADLKRGFAKGASMITPSDTFNLMNSLKLDKGVSPDALPDKPPEGGLDIQWICSFSLPVITLIAMMLLMIMISLLNIIFFWMPWVRICLPFPKMK